MSTDEKINKCSRNLPKCFTQYSLSFTSIIDKQIQVRYTLRKKGSLAVPQVEPLKVL